MKRLTVVALLAAVLGAGFVAVGMAADPSPPVPAVNDMRSTEAILKDVQTASADLKDKVGPMTVLFDADKRKTLGPVAVPILKKLNSLFSELASAEPKYGPSADAQRETINALLALLQDADTLTGLKETAKGSGTSALNANLSLDTAEWWSSKSDAAAQAKVLAKLTDLAKANPTSDVIAETMMIISSTNAASEDLANSAKDVVVSTLTGKLATQLKAEIQGDAKLAANVGKPLVIAGKTAAGDAFTTADWKGKVILVDFWATWCGPCIAELPRVKKEYADMHAKGLEVLGVSNDYAAEDLTKFAKDNPDMPWPSLFDADAAKQQQWNPITLGFGINGIPTMFLIDKKGILRSVTAREDFEAQVPKLLDEK